MDLSNLDIDYQLKAKELIKEHNFLKEYDVDVTDDIEEIKEFNEKDEENVR